MNPEELVSLLRAFAQQADVIAALRAEVTRLNAENEALREKK